MNRIPPLPLAAVRVIDLARSAEPSLGALAQVMESDPAMSAGLLRLANSSYYGVSGGVEHVKRAVSYLGFQTSMQVALAVSVNGVLTKEAQNKAVRPRSFWFEALIVAHLAQKLAPKVDAGLAFTAGLLHGIGIWFAEPTSNIASLSAKTCQTWNFPTVVIEMIATQADPQSGPVGQALALLKHSSTVASDEVGNLPNSQQNQWIEEAKSLSEGWLNVLT